MKTARATESGTSGSSPVKSSWQKRHILDLDDFSPEEIELVIRTSSAMKEVLKRDIKKVPTLRGKTVLTMFYEPSTRTRVSFEMAAKVLSADVIGLSASASSAVKGESLLDTALTLQATSADVIVLRHPHSGAPYFLSRHITSASIINAGDGTHAHPTQALLDLYTIAEKLGDIHGAKVAIVGDIAHSRVARSNLWGLSKLGAHIVLCGPPTLIPWDLFSWRGNGEGSPLPNVVVETDIEKAIEGADVVMALRLQKERQESGLIPSLREYAQRWQVNEERLQRAKPTALVMHPGPMNEGVEISSQVAHSSQAVIEEQVTNGVAVRMALLYLLCTPGEERPLP